LKKSIYLSLILGLLIFVLTGCSTAKPSEYAKFDEVKGFTMDKYFEYVGEYITDPKSVPEFDYLIKLKIDNKDTVKSDQQRLMSMYGANLFKNETKYKTLITPFAPKVIEAMKTGDINTTEEIEKIDDAILKQILRDIKQNRLVVKIVNDDVNVNIDFKDYRTRYEKYMTEEYTDYFKIFEELEYNNIVKDNVVQFDVLEARLKSFQAYVKKYNASTLYPMAVEQYMNHLSFYFGVNNPYVIFKQDGTVQKDAISSYKKLALELKGNELGRSLTTHLNNIAELQFSKVSELNVRTNSLLQKIYESIPKYANEPSTTVSPDKAYTDSLGSGSDLKNQNQETVAPVIAVPKK